MGNTPQVWNLYLNSYLVASADQLVKRVRSDFHLLLEADGHHCSLERTRQIKSVYIFVVIFIHVTILIQQQPPIFLTCLLKVKENQS